MRSPNFMALFCEDIREEANGVVTLIGMLPDNINVATPIKGPSGEIQHDPTVRALARLCVFVRINFDPEFAMPEADVRLLSSDGRVISLGRIDRKTIDLAKEQAKARGNYWAGVVSRAILNGFPVPKSGDLRVEIQFPNESHIAGAIYFQSSPEPSPTAH